MSINRREAKDKEREKEKQTASAVTRAMVVASGMGIANHSSKGYASN